MVELRFYGELRAAIGRPSETAEDGYLSKILDGLQERYGKSIGEKIRHSQIFINEEAIEDRRDRSLQDGDIVRFFGPTAGG